MRWHIDHGVVQQGIDVRVQNGGMCMNIDAVFLEHEHGVAKHRLDVHAPGRQCESNGRSGCTNMDEVCPCMQVLFVERRGVFDKRLAVFEQHGDWGGRTAVAVGLAVMLCFINLRSMCMHIVVELPKWLRLFRNRLRVQGQDWDLAGDDSLLRA